MGAAEVFAAAHLQVSSDKIPKGKLAAGSCSAAVQQFTPDVLDPASVLKEAADYGVSPHSSESPGKLQQVSQYPGQALMPGVAKEATVHVLTASPANAVSGVFLSAQLTHQLLRNSKRFSFVHEEHDKLLYVSQCSRSEMGFVVACRCP